MKPRFLRVLFVIVGIDQDAVKIHTGHAHVANGVEEPSAQNGPDDS